MARWLSDTQMRAWRVFATTTPHLLAALEADLAPHGVNLGDYEVLVNLSEAEDQQLRMCDLSARLGLSPSGLTRRLDGLVELGYVARVPSSADRRVMLATITPEGMAAMQAAAVDHVASVRRHLLDRLGPEQVDALGEIFTAVAAGLGRLDAAEAGRERTAV
jgi:DNA-binding MarR family transcriptional regulator